MEERLPCRTTRRDTAMVALSAVCLCVPRNAGHVTERPRRGIFFAKNAVVGANYSCARVGRTTPRHCLANGRQSEAIGMIRRGKSATHFIAEPEPGLKRRTGPKVPWSYRRGWDGGDHAKDHNAIGHWSGDCCSGSGDY